MRKESKLNTLYRILSIIGAATLGWLHAPLILICFCGLGAIVGMREENEYD